MFIDDSLFEQLNDQDYIPPGLQRYLGASGIVNLLKIPSPVGAETVSFPKKVQAGSLLRVVPWRTIDSRVPGYISILSGNLICDTLALEVVDEPQDLTLFRIFKARVIYTTCCSPPSHEIMSHLPPKGVVTLMRLDKVLASGYNWLVAF